MVSIFNLWVVHFKASNVKYVLVFGFVLNHNFEIEIKNGIEV